MSGASGAPERKYQSARHEHQTSKQGERLRQRRAGQRARPRSLKVQGTAATPQMWSRPIVAETCGCGLRAGCSSRSRTGLAQEECRDPGSNRGPSDLQSDALPTELSRLLSVAVCQNTACYTMTGRRRRYFYSIVKSLLWDSNPRPPAY